MTSKPMTQNRRSPKYAPGNCCSHSAGSRGGRRENAGRPRGAKSNVPHRARPEHKARHPVHLTLRFARGLPSLRRQSLFLAVRRALSAASSRAFRLVHFSVQRDHIHLIVEAHDRSTLLLSSRGLSIRVARAVNHHLDRRGKVLDDRYHARRTHHAARSTFGPRLRVAELAQTQRSHAALRCLRSTLAVRHFGSRAGSTRRLGSPPAWSDRRSLAGAFSLHLARRCGMAQARPYRPH